MKQPPFSTLALHPALLENLASMNYQAMTPIQEKSLPLIIEGKDVIGQAKTGSGKTAAFGLGLLNKLNVKQFRVQSIVLCPTRELADQVAKEIRSLARRVHNIKVLTLCGGVTFGPQKGSLEHGAHIVVGTPGRIEEHLRKKNLSLEHVTTFILDEADRMLDMGFHDAIDKINGYLPDRRQTLLFSATFPGDIEHLSKRLMRRPTRVEVDSHHDTTSIQQILYEIPEKGARSEALLALLQHHQPVSSLVFCNTKLLTEEVAATLRESGFMALAIHGDLEQRDRDYRLVQFANKSLTVLVATDVAARGLDIDSLDLVVNFHLTRDPEVHTHRIGRTGRAGAAGIACSLYHASEAYKLELIEGYTGQVLERLPLPQLSPAHRPQLAPMVTLQIDGGRKQKIRPGDILGALTGENGIAGSQVGKINIFEQSASVAVEREAAKKGLAILREGKLKGRSFRARKIGIPK
ncbi:MAG: ATP-dependent RNA helicase DbpA [Gammaproteobacteria bacterium]|nr:ATP-dependent RNA helicase DbpA [Gammaproteobacteria bacterium]